jgi:hypothetical protein
MVQFNNEKIKIYDLDSINSILKRLSSKENSLPEFIYVFDNNLEDINLINDDININFENLINIFTENKDFIEIYNYIKDKNNFNLEQIVYYYILLNPVVEEIENKEIENREIKGMMSGPFLAELENSIKKIDIDSRIELNLLWNNRYGNLINFKKKIQENKINSEKQGLVFQNFDEIIGIKYTKFELEHIKYELELKIENLSLLEIFNNIKLNNNIPFATTHYFYKILKDFTPYKEWTNLFDRSKTYFDKYKNIDRKTNIILKVLETDDISNSINDYTEVILNVKENIFVKLEHNIKKFNISRDELTNRMLTLLNIDDIKNEKDIGVKGIFYLPNQYMNKYIMLDLIMNDPLFSSILAVDESTMTVKSNIFIHFSNPQISNLTAYITNQKVQKKNPNMKKNIKNYDELFPLNSNYIRVKISKCEGVKQAKYFQKIISKLFVLYNEKSKDIINFYKDNYIDLEIYEEFEDEDQEDNRLKNIDPEIFRSKYTRYCPHPPTYIPDKNLEKIENEGKKIIEFPKVLTGESSPKKYYCNYEKHIYPGLRYNPYNNADILPYIPCCYTKDQEKNKGSKFRNYYFDEPLIEKEKKQQGIYISNIIIPNDNFGTLPVNINKIFSAVDINGVYYRKGVYRTKNSFLNCVLESLNINNIHSINNETKINNLLNKIRKSFATEEYAICCKQEMYNYSIPEIINKIENLDEYFDPKLFIHLLEIKYDCNIFLFSRNNKGELILPNHIKGYYKTKNKNNSIFIFEHMGGESDQAEYPQCELIVRKDIDEEETLDNFEYNNIISKNIFNVFDKTNDSYIFNKKIEFTNFDLFSNNIILPISQIIDTYGKTRTINILYNNNYISIFTTPIQPLKLKEISIKDIYKSDISVIIKLGEELNIKFTNQIIDENNFVKEIEGILGNIKISIPIENGLIIEGISINKSNINYPENNISTIELYNKYKKLSRYITEYLFWLYSNFIYEENINEKDILSDDILNNFKNKYIEIINNFEYNNIPKSFDTDSGLMNDNKLILKSEETLKRLFYILKLYIVRNYKNIISYRERTMIQNFYEDITDFDLYPFQVLLEGEESIIKWIKEKNKQNIIYNYVLINTNEPYYFKNKLISNRIYIAQNTDSYNKAVNICLTWIKNKYNPMSNVMNDEKELECVLYSYTNNKNIKKYNIEGKENDYNIQIIGYKINGNPFYTSLLYI